MAEGGNNDRYFLSDTEILDALERLLRHPDFYDISLSFDSGEGKFYAGWEVGSDLRDVLRTVLMRNRPAGLSLNTLLPSLVQQDKDTKKGNFDHDVRDGTPASGKSASGSLGVLLHRTES
jgi:predicted heme/steroid binding protein